MLPLTSTTLVGLVALSLASCAMAQVGKRYPSEKRIEPDPVTGVPLTILTDGKASDAKIYQTHPQWTADGKWIVFRSSGRAQGSQAYAVNENTGDIVQLTDGAGNNTGTLNLARKSMKVYYLRNQTQRERGFPATQPTTQATTEPTTQPEDVVQMIELDLGTLLADAMANSVKSPESYERVVTTLPQGLRESGGFGLDANEDVAYLGVRGGDTGEHLPPGTEIIQTEPGQRMGAGPAGLRSIHLQTGALKVVLDTPFLMGHVQANPFKPGEILYCHETGGDAKQRMWITNADGSNNRPLFKEEPLDWVTHETFVGPDEVMFNLIGHQSRLRVRPTGIAIINTKTNAVELIGQVTERQEEDKNDLGVNAAGRDSYGGFWHCNGSFDGKWAVGDTFTGNLWLIDRKTGKRSLLSTDHKMKPDHLHPTFSDDSTRVLVQSGRWTDGQRLQLVVIPVPRD